MALGAATSTASGGDHNDSSDHDRSLSAMRLGCWITPSSREAAANASPTLTGSIERISLSVDGGDPNRASATPTVTPNGRFVAFYSSASNLVPGDTNAAFDVFVYDRSTDTMERVSVGPAETEANADSFSPAISRDGRFVSFRSAASNLVAGDVNGKMDVFIRDRAAHVTERVSVSSAGREANAHIATQNMSADGRVVAFSTTASNLVPRDTNDEMDVFVRDLESSRTTRITIGHARTQANKRSHSSTISADGRYVGFRSFATNLVRGDTNGIADDFVFDRALRKTERVNVSSEGRQANNLTFRPHLNANGRYVTFRSAATTLVRGDTNGQIDVFVRDRVLGKTKRVNLSSTGRQANGLSHRPSLSPGGRYVTFASNASNLVPSDTNGVSDVFVYDAAERTITRESVGGDDRQADACSRYPRMSAAGHVVFMSVASNLVPGDRNANWDIYIRLPRS